MVVDLHHEQAVGQRAQQLEQANCGHDADDHAKRQRRAGEPDRKPADQPSTQAGECEPPEQHGLKHRQRQAVSRRGAINAVERAGEKIVQHPAKRARHLARQWLRHVGADHQLLAQEFVARRHLPVRARGVDGPVCEVIGIDLQVTDGGPQRPVVQEAPERAAKQIVVALRALRIVALDVEDMPPPDQSICACVIREHRRKSQ